MSFDVNKMYNNCIRLINDFKIKHSQETFYAFAIAHGGLHLNSLTKLEEQVNYYIENYNEYFSCKKSTRKRIKWSIGDWGYRHFISLDEIEGYDTDLFDKYYNLCLDNKDPELPKTTEYYQAMEKLLHLIMNSEVFGSLRKTKDFKVFFIAADD